MKVFVFAFAALFACVAALPQNEADEKSVTGDIFGAIEAFKQHLKDDGYDPFNFDFSTEHRLPKSDLLVMVATIKEFVVVGLSDIIITNLSYNFITQRVYYQVHLPSISVTIAEASVYTKTFGYETDSKISGRVDFLNSWVSGVIKVDTTITGGDFAVEWISADASLGHVESFLEAKLLNEESSDKLNTLLVDTFPRLLKDVQYDLDVYVEYLAWKLVDWIRY